jgi:hypothetical protein
MNRRTGATLIEVLVAIFVAALGLLALLALFPVGAFSMAQAIKDSRTALAAANAAALANAMNLTNDPDLWVNQQNNGVSFFTNPGPPTGLTPLQPGKYSGPSYSIYIDPVGFNVLGYPGTIAGVNQGGIRRRSLSFLTQPTLPANVRQQMVVQSCYLLDDLTFDQTGVPALFSGPNGQTNIEREGRYSWAYLLRRPDYSNPAKVAMTVVVYQGGRPPISGETAYDPTANNSVVFTQGSNVVTVSWNPAVGQAQPNIRRGSWILDATMRDNNGSPEPHGFFYRVTNVDDLGNNQLQLELQSNALRSTTNNGRAYGVLAVLESVAEVFEK